jgi:hypothetical protein
MLWASRPQHAASSFIGYKFANKVVKNDGVVYS